MVGTYHVFTSPDVQGFHVADDSLPLAKREAIAVLDRLAEIDGCPKPDFTFEGEARRQAA